MNKLSPCPQPGELEELAAGRQSPAEMESLVQHLEGCDECLDRVRTLSPSDTLIEALSKARPVPLGVDEPTVTQLMKRLAKIAQSESLDATLEATQDESAADEGAAAPEVAWDFLAPAQQPGELGRLGPYRVLRVLGRGGMGVVFLAEDPRLQREVALKALLPALATSPSAKKRFVREARAAAAVKHDHIVRILEVGEDRGVPFLAMEFLEGESLGSRMKRERLPLVEVLRVGRQVAEGLAAAHDRGLIHRDVKPGNIWLEPRVKILDFGLARSTGDQAQLTRSGAILGTPAYMAPEQATGQPLDHRCDLFGLGCVLYRMATGELPFKGKNTLTVLAALANTTPTPPRELNPRLPVQLADLILQLLAKNREQRPASAHRVIEALDACPSEEDTAGPVLIAPRVELGRPGPRAPRKKRVALAGVAFLGVAAIIIFLNLPKAADNNGAENKALIPPPKAPTVDNSRPIKEKTPDPPSLPDYALALDGHCAVVVPALRLSRSEHLTLEAYVIVRKMDDRNPTHLVGVPQQFSLFTGQTQAMDGEHWSLGVQYEGSFHHLFEPAVIPLGRRVHLAGVREGRSTRLYVDGKLVASRDVDEPLLNDSESVFSFGNNAGLEGSIDEIRISRTARYDRDFIPAKRFEPDKDTLALYHLDEGEGTEIKDASANKHHGTIHGNAPRWVKSDGTPIAPAP